MARQTYFICATPGTLGNFLGRVLKDLLSADTADIIFPFTEDQTGILASDDLTPEYFYNNLQVPDEGTYIVNSPFRPNYDILRQRFPECKIIVVSHSVQEIQLISRALFRDYFMALYEAGAEPFFRKIINDHDWLFSSNDVTVENLTRIEKEIFVKILAHQKLLDGFHCLTIPADPGVIEVKFDKIFYHLSDVETQLETLTGNTFTESEKLLHANLIQGYVKRYFSLLSY